MDFIKELLRRCASLNPMFPVGTPRAVREEDGLTYIRFRGIYFDKPSLVRDAFASIAQARNEGF
jgi:hypothetical protein